MLEISRRGLVLVVAIFCSLSFESAAGASKVEARIQLIVFSLEDQFGRQFTEGSWPDSGLILVAGDRVGSRYTSDWGQALRGSLRERGHSGEYEIVGLSDLASVPRLLRKTIKKRFPRETEQWVLLDWEGLFAGSYGFEQKSCNLLAFSSEGVLLLRQAVKEFDDTTLDKILSVLAPVAASD